MDNNNNYQTGGWYDGKQAWQDPGGNWTLSNPGQFNSFNNQPGQTGSAPAPQAPAQPKPQPSQGNVLGAQTQSPPDHGMAVSTPNFVQGTPNWVQPIIQKYSEKYNLPTALLSALLKQESGFNVRAQSPVGASGIAQFMPGTARGMGVNPLDPESAIEGAARYLRTAWDKFGKPELALAAYNAGSGAVNKYGGIPPYKETQNYVKNIMAMAGGIHQTANGPMLDLAKGQTDRLNVPAQVGAVAGMNPQMAQQYRDQVQQTVPRFPLPQQLANFPVLGGLANGVANAIPNAVAGMASLPAARTLGQGLGDLGDITGGALMGGAALKAGRAGLSALARNPMVNNQIGGLTASYNDQPQAVQQDLLQFEQLIKDNPHTMPANVIQQLEAIAAKHPGDQRFPLTIINLLKGGQ